MPEGDTILSIAGQLRPVLVGERLDKIEIPQRRHALDRWPEKLAGARIGAIERWDGEPVLGSAVESTLVERGSRSGPRRLTLTA